MATRRLTSTLQLTLVVVLVGSALSCGDPRPQAFTGKTNCTSCHGFPPETGAHAVHLALAPGIVGCFQCHKDVQDMSDPDHIFRADGTLVPAPAQVRFDDPKSIAGKGGLDPSYDPATQTCSNVYCHGNFNASKTVLPPLSPVWNGGAAVVACGTCHDLPPPAPTHVPVLASQGCGTSTNAALACHPAAFTPTSVDPKLHVDGLICPPSCTPSP